MTNARDEVRQTISSAGLIGSAAIIGAGVGFILQLLVAYFYGASSQTDAYFMALSTSDLLNKLLMGGSVTAVFLPMFVDQIARNRRNEAWGLGLNLLHLSGSLFVLLIGIIGVFARPFVHFIAPGFDEATTALTVSILRVLLPSFLFLFIVDMGTAMLHALRRFTIPATLRIIAPLSSIVGILLFYRTFGIFALAFGTVLSALLQLLLIAKALRSSDFHYRWFWQPKDPSVRRLVGLVYPFVFSMLVTQGAGIVYRILVSGLSSGSLSALKYSEKITQLATIIFLNSVTTVIYPLLSAKASRADYLGIRDTLSSAIRLTLFVAIPIVIGVFLLRDPLIGVIFRHGLFTAEAASLTSIALGFLVLGLATNAVSSVLGHAVLALQETRAAVAVTIVSQAVAIILFVLLVPYFAHAGLALASSLVPLSSGLLYFLFLRRYVPGLSRIFWHKYYFKIALLSGALVAVIFWVSSLVPAASSPLLTNLLQLVIPAVAGSLVFFGGAYLWHIEEMRHILSIILATWQKWIGRMAPALSHPE